MSGRDAGSLFGRALRLSAAAHDVTLTITGVHSTRWVSATFVGAHHKLSANAEDDDLLARWLAAVPEEELAVRGQFVADLAIDEVKHADGRAAIVFAALTVEDQ